MNAMAPGDLPACDADAAIGFLRQFRPEGPWCLTSILPDSNTTTTRTFTAASVEEMKRWIVQENARKGVYFMVNDAKAELNKKAKKTDVAAMAWIHVDLDVRAGETPEDDRPRLLAKLREFQPKPTVIVDSGHGYQAFFRLTEEQPIDGDETTRARRVADLEAYNEAIAAALGAPPGCANIDRVMRLPGTTNWPNKQKLAKGWGTAPAKLVEAEWSRVYPLSAFTPTASPRGAVNGDGRSSSGVYNGVAAKTASPAPLGALPNIESADNLNDRVSLRTRALIVQGVDFDEPNKWPSRSELVFHVACELVRAGHDEGQIASVLLNKDFGISAHCRAQPNPIEYAARQARRAREEATAPWLRELNARYAVVTNQGGKCRVVILDDDPVNFQSFEDFRNAHMDTLVDVGTDANGKAIRARLGKAWLENLQRRKYKRVEFLPGQDAPDDVYNLWKGWSVAPREGDCSLYLELMRKNICNGNDEHFDWLLDHMAHRIQRPSEPSQIAVVLRGGSGIGKGQFVKHFGSLFGSGFIELRDPHHAVGHFNAILHQKLVVYLDESFAAADKKIEGILKGLITETNIIIEKKGLDAFDARRYFALFLASNKQWVVPVEIDDRRYFVLDVNDGRKGDNEFFEALNDQMVGGGREALMHMLSTRDISKFNHRKRPKTKALNDQKLFSLQGADKVVYGMLENRAPPVAKVDGARIFVATRDLYDRDGKHCSETALGRALARVAENKVSVREMCDGKQRAGYWLPRLRIARENWAAAMKLDVGWPNDDGLWTGCDPESDVDDDRAPF